MTLLTKVQAISSNPQGKPVDKNSFVKCKNLINLVKTYK